MNTDKLRELAEEWCGVSPAHCRPWNDKEIYETGKAILELLDALKEIGEIRSRTFVSLNSVPVSLPENELWIKATDLQAILDKL